MAEENPNPQQPVPPAESEQSLPPADVAPVPPAAEPVPPAGVAPVPPAQQSIPQAGATPVPPAQQPVPPAGATPVPPAQHPVPPAGAAPVPPAQQPVSPAGAAPVPPAQQPVNPAGPNPHIPQRPGNRPPGAGHPRRNVPHGRRPTSKKVPGPVSPRSTSYRKPVKPPETGIGFMSILLAVLGVAMLIGTFSAILPKSLKHIEGYPADDMTNREPKNLLAVGQKILETRSEDATFTEREVNDYINYRLRGVQKGSFGGLMKVRGIYVDLRPNEAEIFVERSFPIIGRTTMSNVVESYFNEQKHQQIWKMGGGSIGKITLKGRSLQPVINVFLRMSKVGAAELEVLNYMADVKLQENKITLDSSL